MYILFVINYQKLMKNKGFTLIELLVAVAIIGILAPVGVVARLSYGEVFFREGTQQEIGQTIIKVSDNNIITLTSVFQNSGGVTQDPIITA